MARISMKDSFAQMSPPRFTDVTGKPRKIGNNTFEYHKSECDLKHEAAKMRKTARTKFDEFMKRKRANASMPPLRP